MLKRFGSANEQCRSHRLCQGLRREGRVLNRVGCAHFAKTFQSQLAGIAFAAGNAFRRWIVTTLCQRKIDMKLECLADNIRFRTV